MKILFLFLALLSTNLFGVDSSIYTWGYGEIFYKVLQGVTILSGESYLFKVAIGVGALLLTIRSTVDGSSNSDNGLAMLKYLIFVTLVLGLFVETKKNYIVEDEITGQTFPVANVPIGIGETFSMFTMLERSLAKAFEVAFATPNSISYSKVGLGFTMVAPENLLKVEIKDGYTTMNFNSYVDNCLLSALAAGEIAPDVLSKSLNLKNDLEVTGYLSPWYSATSPQGVDMQCQDVWSGLKNSITSELDMLAGKAAASSYLDTQTFKDGMTQTTQLLFGASQSANDYIMQQTLINMGKQGLSSALLATGGDAANLAYSSALAEKLQQSTWQMSGILAQQNLPLMKAVFTILVLGIFILLVILSLVFGNMGHIKMGFTLLLAMVLWTPLAILINGMMNIALERVIPVMSGGGLSFSSMNDISSQLKSYISFMGFLASSIPIFAYSIAKMSEHGFVSFFSNAGASGGASMGSKPMTDGNISQGNTSTSKFSVNDQIGSHDYHGANNWGHRTSGDTGAIRSEFSNGAGAGTLETNNAGKVGNMVINSQTGEISKVEGSTVSYGASQEIIKGRDEAKATAQTDATNLSTAIGTNLTNSLLKNGSVIDTTSTNHNTGFHKNENEAVSKIVNESADTTFKDMIKNGKTFNFTGENGVSGTLGAGFDGKILGIGASGNGQMTISGKTSEGKDFSTTLSTEDSKTFRSSFNKNIGEQISNNEDLTKALSKQVVENKGFGDSSLASLGDTYNKSFSTADTLTNSIHEGANDRNSFSQDLNPKILNKMIDNDEELRTLRDKGGKEGKYKAAEIADDRLNSVMYKDDVLKAYQDVTGVKLDTKTANIPTDLQTAKTDFQTLQTNNDNNSNALIAQATSRVAQVPSSVAAAPKNQNDLDSEEKKVIAEHDNDKTKLEAKSKKEIKSFEDKNSLGTEAIIDKKESELEKKVDNASKKITVKQAAAENPAMPNTVKKVLDNDTPVSEPRVNTGKIIKDLDKSGVIDHNIYGDSKVNNWKAIEQLPLQRIEALKKFDDWSSQDDKRFDDIISKKSKPAGGMGGDTLDGGSGTDTFQPPLPEVTTKIQEQPKQQVAEQVSRPQMISEQPIQSKDDFTKSMIDKGVFEDKSGSNVNWDKFSKLEQQEVDTYMNHFAKDANAAENQNDFNRNNQNSGTQNFESQPESRREPERVQTTQPREERVEPTKQPQEITRPQAVDEHISKSNLETEEGQRLKEQNEESTQSIKKLFKELEELKESQ
jgi:conjugal transfer mating pair stabilization protein TraG